MPIHVMQLEVGVAGLPNWKSLNQEVDERGNMWEGYLVLILCKDRQWMW